MNRAALVLLTAFVPVIGTSLALAQAKPADDPMLAAMQAELAREQASLLLPGMQRPYYMEYRLDDIARYEVVANYGALTREEDVHQRVIRVTVRVGSYEHDNSSAKGEGTAQLAPEENNPQALRYALWLATDDAYKNALRAYASKQASLKQFEQERREADFAHAKPTTHIEPLRQLELDRAEWRRRMVEASGLYATAPEVRSFAEAVQYSTANLRAVAVNSTLVNTEGTVTRDGYSGYSANISVGGQAADGMRLGRENGSTATTAAGLQSWPAFRKRVLDDLQSFDQLRHAPVVAAEDYHGPVLFSGDASADVFNRLFVPNVEADRPEPGTTARTTGAYNSSLHSRVLPELLSVTDDPTRTTLDGQQLLGAYAVDDEGTPAERADLVRAGKLEAYDIGREPVRDFPVSNGHGRAAPGQPAHSRAGVILITPTHPLSPAEMDERLLAFAKEQNRDVYFVETLFGELTPRMLYLVHPDGTRQLVRGATFDELDNRSLRSSIVAAGGTPYIAQSLGSIPQTTVAPEILFDDIGVKRATEEQQKLPYYPPPPVEGAAAPTSAAPAAAER